MLEQKQNKETKKILMDSHDNITEMLKKQFPSIIYLIEETDKEFKEIVKEK